MHLSSEEGLPETSVKAKMRQFKMAVAISDISNFFPFFLSLPVKLEVSFITVLSMCRGKNQSGNAYDSFFSCFLGLHR